MPLIDTHADAVAVTYAHALFELARSAGGQHAIEAALAELDEFVDLARADPMFGEFVSSQVISPDHRARSLEKIFRGKMSDLTLHFLLVLNDRGRLANIIGIASAFDALVQRSFGRVEVDAYTVAPLSAEEKNALQESLSKRLGSQVVLHAYTDPAMIGGIRFQVGDQLLDASISTQLRAVRQQLAENGPARIRAAAEKMFRGDPSSNGH